MKSKKKIVFGACSLVIITAILTTLLLTSFGFLGIVPYSKYKKYNKLMALDSIINSKFYKKPNDEELQKGMMKGLFYGLGDVYSSYYTKDEMFQLLSLSTGKYVGVGIMVRPDEKSGSIKIDNVIEGGPAEEAGIKKGDLIIKIDGRTYTYQELDLGVKKMRGKEGTPVEVTLSRDGKILTKKIVRREVIVQSVSSKMLEDKIGYIDIKSFEEETYNDFDKAVKTLKSQGMKALIIDVRDDPGGLLDIVQKVAGRIIGKGNVVYTVDNKGEKSYLKSDFNEKLNLPLVILTNGNSASASEILTGAIIDSGLGISIGTTTYGKGLVQEVIQLKDGSGCKITTAEFFTPKGNSINKKGIKPTIEVKEKDQQLPKAMEYLKEKIK